MTAISRVDDLGTGVLLRPSKMEGAYENRTVFPSPPVLISIVEVPN
jgi:hypothetical protein